MADIVIAKRIVDWVGLNARNPPEEWLRLWKEMSLVLALTQGMGPDGAQLLLTDAAGNLRVTTAGSTSGQIGPLALGVPGSGQFSGANALGDGVALLGIAGVAPYLWSNVSAYIARSASQANLTTQPIKGTQLTALPGLWLAFSAPALGAQASAVRAAGGAGISHVCTGFEIVVSSQAAPLVGQLLINLRDGASGAGTILKTWAIEIPAALYAPVVIARSGCSYVGSAATAMTLESSAAYTAVGVSVAFDGYDAV